jgi:hypothetical protein
MALWTVQEQQSIKPITSNNVQALFNQLQTEVEMCDIQQYLGLEFYQELKRNTAAYSTLLNGGTYTLNGVSYSFGGLKKVFAYLLYARYVRQSYIQDTFSGMVQHTGEGFQRLSSAELQNQEARYKDVAGTLWDECLMYLCTLSLPYFPQQVKRSKTIQAL